MAMKSPVVGVLTARGRSWSAAGAGVLKNPNKDVCPGPNPLLTPPTPDFLKPRLAAETNRPIGPRREIRRAGGRRAPAGVLTPPPLPAALALALSEVSTHEVSGSS